MGTTTKWTRLPLRLTTISRLQSIFSSRPRAPIPVYGWVSTLFLCRKELQDCFIGGVVDESEVLEIQPHRLFATAMVALSGIELLATMGPPPCAAKRSDMFVSTATRFSVSSSIALSSEEATILWSFRNALSHTFGLFHLDENGAVVPIYVYSTDNPGPVVTRLESPEGNVAWEICIESLVALFLNIVHAFETHTRTDHAAAEWFLPGFAKHGRIFHKGPHIVRGGGQSLARR